MKLCQYWRRTWDVRWRTRDELRLSRFRCATRCRLLLRAAGSAEVRFRKAGLKKKERAVSRLSRGRNSAPAGGAFGEGQPRSGQVLGLKARFT